MTYPTQRYVAERPDGHTLEGIPGDCYRTCLAILLDVAVDQVPHVIMHGSAWWDVTRRTVRELRPGWDITCTLPTPFPPYDRPSDAAECQQLAIATGPSPRGRFPHCVIIDALSGEFVWDPHPSRDFLGGDVEDLDILVRPYEPMPADPIALPVRGSV